jgi:FkbM family methyltransferase
VSSSAEAVALRPAPERAGRCPRCARSLEVRRIRVPGWRAVVEGRCGGCGHVYVQDLPAGHGLVYPATLDLDTGETFDRVGAAWFANALRESWERPDVEPVTLDMPLPGEGPATLLNCLDPVYGHALLKLLNTSRLLGRGRRPIVLVPQALEVLVPPGCEAWIVREPLARLRGWLVDVERRLDRALDRIGDCVLARAFPHPHPSTWTLAAHTQGIEPEPVGTPSIVFALRDDRTWGPTVEDQLTNVTALWDRLRERFPSAGAAAVGVGEPSGLPRDLLDVRAPAPTADDERRWLALAAGATVAIGVHGSHLLLPSGLARATVELLPEPRFANALQATLVTERDSVLALARQRTVHGSDDLADVTTERVAAIAVPLIEDLDRVGLLMAGPAAGRGAGETLLPPLEGAVAAEPVAAPARSAPERALRAPFAVFASSLRKAALAREERALGRRIRSTRLPAVLEDARGARFELVDRVEVESFLRNEGHFERDELELVAATLEPGMTAVDAGANIGAFTVVMARRAGPRGRVHAFEPSAVTRPRLERTLALNGIGTVCVHALALSDRTGQAELFGYGRGYESWATLAPRVIELADVTLTPAERTQVATVTLDEHCDRHGIDRIDTLKVDVEGAERRVLAGARGLLDRGAIDLALIELSDATLESFGDRAYEVVDTLERTGMTTFSVEHGAVRPFRAAGYVDRLVTLVACTSRGLARLTRSGAVRRPLRPSV